MLHGLNAVTRLLSSYQCDCRELQWHVQSKELGGTVFQIRPERRDEAICVSIKRLQGALITYVEQEANERQYFSIRLECSAAVIHALVERLSRRGRFGGTYPPAAPRTSCTAPSWSNTLCHAPKSGRCMRYRLSFWAPCESQKPKTAHRCRYAEGLGRLRQHCVEGRRHQSRRSRRLLRRNRATWP